MNFIQNLSIYCEQSYLDIKEGKSSVTIAIGCTGGQHRSVALTERVGAELKEEDYHVNITHRDRLKRKETVNRS